MTKISVQTLKNSYKPYDIVTNKKGDVGFIDEVNMNECQDTPENQISNLIK